MPSRNPLEPSVPRTLIRARRRIIATTIVDRCQALPEDERDLLLAVFEQGRTIQQVVRRQDPDPATLSRRSALARRNLRRLVRRILCPTFDVVRRLGPSWPPAMARVGHACFIRGLSMREAADALDISLYNVRRHAQAIRAIALASLNTPSPAPTPNQARDRAA